MAGVPKWSGAFVTRVLVALAVTLLNLTSPWGGGREQHNNNNNNTNGSRSRSRSRNKGTTTTRFTFTQLASASETSETSEEARAHETNQGKEQDRVNEYAGVGLGAGLRGGASHMMTTTTTTTTVLGVLAGDADLARRVTEGKPATILAHAASVLPDLTHAVDALYNPPSASGGGGGGGEARRALKGGRKGKWKGRSGVNLVSVLAPEHGFRGDKQAGHGGGNSTVDPRTGLTVFSIYNKAPKDIVDVVVGKSGAKVVLVDLQDSGARFYTYIWTLYDLLVAAAITNSSGAGVKVVVLDRPNPLGGVDPQGPVLDAEGGAFVSGVGKRPTPMKHAMTMGELAVLFNEEYVHFSGCRTRSLRKR